MICMRAISACFCRSRPSISLIWSSSFEISFSSSWLRASWCAIAPFISKRPISVTSAAEATAAPIDSRNSWRRRLRSDSRHGSRLTLGMSVEAPQRQTARREQRGRILLNALRKRARRDLHLAQWITALGRDADAARDHVCDAGDVGAPTADQQLLGLLATGP